jgi:hypothetical protein
MVNAILTRVGLQFTVGDTFHGNDPLLVLMSDPNHVFFKGLELFQQRICFSNVEKDRNVRYTTASMCTTNPYYKYEPIPVDEKYPNVVSFSREIPKKKKPWTFSSTISFLFQMGIFSILLPILLLFAPIVLTYQAFKASFRQKRIPIETSWILKDIKPDSDTQDSDTETPTSTLAISKDQKRKKMIRNLNKLEWIKVDLYFDVLNAHAAIVRREPFYKDVQSGDALSYLAEKVFQL